MMDFIDKIKILYNFSRMFRKLFFVFIILPCLQSGPYTVRSDGVASKEELELWRRRSLTEEFSRHDVITPRVFDTSSRQILQYTPRNNVSAGDKEQVRSTAARTTGHHNQITVLFTAFNKDFNIQLHINRYLFGENYTEKSIHRGFERRHNEQDEHIQSHCYYSGQVVGDSTSFAALSTCQGLRGYFVVNGEGYHLEPLESSSSLTAPHYIFRDSDYFPRNISCGHGNYLHTFKESWPTSILKETSHKRMRRRKRSGGSSIHWPYDANDKTMVIELYVANDNAQYTALKSDIVEVIRRTKDIVNIVSSLYRPLNMYVALVGVEVWVDGDKIEIVDNADKTMNNFLDYRRNFISPKHRNDNAQLITGRTLGDGVVGKAPIMTICTWQYSGGVNLDHSPLVGPVATTVAHEMGHNFGLTHDVETCGCPDDRCIMAPSSGGLRNPTKWSECSKQQFADGFHQGMDYCLHNIPDELYGEPVCGNGFTEAGEQCDCGLPQDCTNVCCNATTCRLMGNASCAMGECCDRSTCKPKPMATLCRGSRGACDLTEHCNGVDEFCPSDIFREDGTECLVSGVSSYCYNGRCESADTQCKLLWGPTGQMSHKLCYEHFNVMGTANGHCGFNWVEGKTFKKCEQRDVMCGMLHCRHRNEKLMFWKEALAYTLPEAMVMVNNTRQDCKGVILDVGLDMPDPGMVPDGVKCGDWKMCINQQCEDIDSLGIKHCPDCHGHGVCNSIAQCHCDSGYAPPNCDRSGNGGSEHSGPIMIRQSSVGLVVGMCLLFLVILPVIGLLIYCAYRHREKLKRAWIFRNEYRSVYRAAPRNDAEKPPTIVRANAQLPPSVIAVNTPLPAATRPGCPPPPEPPSSQSHNRPRSVLVHSSSVAGQGSRPPNIRRAQSFRPQDISGPELKSCTNPVVCQSVGVPRPMSCVNENLPVSFNAGTSDTAVPTRVAPAPPVSNKSSAPIVSVHPKKGAPERPPLPRVASRRNDSYSAMTSYPPSGESGVGEISQGEGGVDGSREGRTDNNNIYEEITSRSPSYRPPDPPDSRHRFYSSSPSHPHRLAPTPGGCSGSRTLEETVEKSSGHSQDSAQRNDSHMNGVIPGVGERMHAANAPPRGVAYVSKTFVSPSPPPPPASSSSAPHRSPLIAQETCAQHPLLHREPADDDNGASTPLLKINSNGLIPNGSILASESTSDETKPALPPKPSSASPLRRAPSSPAAPSGESKLSHSPTSSSSSSRSVPPQTNTVSPPNSVNMGEHVNNRVSARGVGNRKPGGQVRSPGSAGVARFPPSGSVTQGGLTQPGQTQAGRQPRTGAPAVRHTAASKARAAAAARHGGATINESQC